MKGRHGTYYCKPVTHGWTGVAIWVHVRVPHVPTLFSMLFCKPRKWDLMWVYSYITHDTRSKLERATPKIMAEWERAAIEEYEKYYDECGFTEHRRWVVL